MTTRTEGPRDPVLAAYDRQVDGLFTYCLSVLCEHDAAAAALREVRELALRHGTRLAEPGLVRAWLYSLARYCCLRRLEDGAGFGPGAAAGAVDAAAGAGASGTETAGAGASGTEVSGLSAAEAGRRRRELASLAWPEAAGTDPEQREALELSVRHRLSPIEVAAVLGVPFESSRALLASAEAEVGRTRAALLVLGVGSCPELDRLGGAGAESWRDWVLGPALRRELVQHVADCPTCRGTAERVAGEVMQGAEGLSGLPVLSAPGTAGALRGDGATFLPRVAGETVWRRSSAPVIEPGLRFDQGGFPRHRAPDSGRARAVRRRVVTTGVLAAVLAAPVVALWAGHRGGGGTGAAASVSSVRVEDDGRAAGRRPNGPVAGQPGQAGGVVGAVGAAPAVAGLELAGAGPRPAETLLPGIQGPAIPVPGRGATPLGSPTLIAAPAPAATTGTGTGPGSASAGSSVPAPVGLLTVEAGDYGNRTVLTLTNSGATEIRWHAEVDAAWLRLSRDAGTLAPGQRITVIVTVDEDLAPNTHWTARIALPPSQAVVTLEGGPQHRGGSTTVPAEPSATPTAPGPAPTGGTPSAPPTGPGPTASPSSPSATASPSSPSATASPTATPTAAPTAAPSATPTGTPTGAPTGTPSGTASTGAPASPAPTGGASAPASAR
ncbi:sigma-70 family RNA polymerase sigma factor [Kitasatospora sp. NPDC058218]|uniref:BACON domain-containing protein n=1 Tax=Kitasatospora sp. NPDC058218 TaxID=3346385 RepID=UPI0036DEDE47